MIFKIGKSLLSSLSPSQLWSCTPYFETSPMWRFPALTMSGLLASSNIPTTTWWRCPGYGGKGAAVDWQDWKGGEWRCNLNFNHFILAFSFAKSPNVTQLMVIQTKASLPTPGFVKPCLLSGCCVALFLFVDGLLSCFDPKDVLLSSPGQWSSCRLQSSVLWRPEYFHGIHASPRPCGDTTGAATVATVTLGNGDAWN